ncbi:hypothetical protein [Pelomonas sp. Root1444]|uniref:hypothetical protein n=1 Tax=Pelomonas sp. Root1444 TaxID=1736464 RepID=UPI0007024CA3|nr:hypothetical protein [Pelomonas sp. Root1444]KQY85968.1 hypothetical protein ASD35_20245 [Pelomonas sp. Root1444]
MTQTRRDNKLKQALGQRLTELVDDHLQMPLDELADWLGYANTSTLRQARNGEALLSVEKLARLAELKATDGRRVSVHWLLTGEGLPLQAGDDVAWPSRLVERLQRASPAVRRKIEAFLEIQEA